ncbi:hypothetical protein BGX34_008310 [Mortierella sp. NVP85]|nr:hypothetical protein BGX34_008310 [Mortierella sp. NVP85]
MPPYSPAVIPDGTTFGDVKVRPTSIPQNPEQDLIQQNGWSDHGDGTDLPTTIATNTPSPPVPSTSSFSMSAPQPIPVPLVMGFKCGKCGAPLESDTAVCKKLHALSFVETFVQNATKLDLEERRRYNTGVEWTGSASAPPVAGPSSSPYGSYQHHPQPQQQQQQQQQQHLGNQETRIPHNGSNGHYPGYHPYYTRESEDSSAHSISSSNSTSNSIPTVENNHGTDNTYIRRSISVQNPVTTLKKFWRDTKTEIKNQSSRSQRSSVHYEIVAPPPLPSLAGNSGGGSSSNSSNTTMGGLNRSNTLTPNPTPAYNPSFVSHELWKAMASDKSTQQDPSLSEPQAASPQETRNYRPSYPFAVLEQEINRATQALQSSVFGGLEALSREMSAFERNSREFFEQGGHLQRYHQHFADGVNKRFRITIEELPPLEDGSSSGKTIGSSLSSNELATFTTTTLIKGRHQGDDLTISHGKPGTPDEGKTVITTSVKTIANSVSPGLLDWLLFVTRLALPKTDDDRGPVAQGDAKIRELSNAEAESAKTGQPSLVEKVKQMGTNWQKDTGHWWQRGHDDSRNGDQSWGYTESYNQTTVTRPDGTIEHRTVNNLNGEIETTVKIRHPDGTIEESVTRENRRRYVSDEDRKRDSVAAVVAEAMATERLAARDKEQPQPQQEKSRSWSPKAWIRRQERDD